MRVFPLLSAVLLFFTTPPQTDLSLKRSLDSFDAVIEKLLSNYPHNRELATRLDELSRNARELRRAGIASPESSPSDMYIESLNADVALLNRLTPDSPLSEISGTVEEVILDLKLKVKFSGVARGSPYELIEVVAHTIEQGAEVSGYEIWYVPRGWAKTKGKERRFDHLSPSRMNLAPGNFVIWAQRNGVASERIPVTLGDDKRSTRDIEISNIRRRWTALIRGAGFLGLAVAGFVRPPNVYDPATTFGAAKAFALFLVAISLGLSVYASRSWSRKKDLRLWLTLSIVLTILTFLSYLASERFKDTYTCSYGNKAVIIGTSLTGHGLEYVETERGVTCGSLLMDHEGKADEVWTADSIKKSKTILIATYLMSFLLAALCIISITQVVVCSSKAGAS